MIDAVDHIESVVNWVIFVGAAAFEIFALVDAATRPARMFVEMGKLSKEGWVLILLLALLTSLAFRSPLGILGLLGLVAASVYMADVRPAVSTRRGRR